MHASIEITGAALPGLLSLPHSALWLTPLAVLAGVLTTVAGVGGGMLMVVVLSAVGGPKLALAITAPALLLGNLHRAALLRHSLDRRIAGLFLLGVVPGAVAGGLLAVRIDASALRWALVVMVAYAGARELGWVRWRPRARALVPVAGLGGFMTATTGAGGLLVAPALLASGLRGPTFVATGALLAASMHITRVVVYGAGGWLSRQVLIAAPIVALGVIVGNTLGRRLHDRVTPTLMTRLTYAVLTTMLALSLLGALAR